MTNRSRVKDPHILAPKQQKMAIFDKTDFWGLKYPLGCVSNMKHVVLYVGHLYQPFWTIKIRPGRQEGPKTAKRRYIWYLQKYPILAVFGPSYQPGRIFMVQNGWYRCPAYGGGSTPMVSMTVKRTTF